MKKLGYLFLIFIFLINITLTGCKKQHKHEFINGICECGQKEAPKEEKKVYKNCIWYIDDEVYYQEKMLLSDEVVHPELPEYVNPTSAKWIGGTFSDGIIDGVHQYSYHLSYKVKEFGVVFYDQDGNVLKAEVVKYGKDATAPKYDSNYSVTWDKDFTNVKSDLNIIGTIVKTSSIIKYYDGDNLLKEETYVSGSNYELYEPNKEGYFFVGWFLDDTSLYRIDELPMDEDSDLELYARYNRLDFSDITLPSASGEFVEIRKSGMYFQPVLPAGALPGVSNYTWSTSDSSVAEVSGYSSLRGGRQGICVLTATLVSDPKITYNCLIEFTGTGFKKVTLDELNSRNIYTVTFKGKNGEVLDEQRVVEGYTAIHPNVPSYEGYAFNGWDKEAFNITCDTTITATYIEGKNRFEGKTISIIGDSISTYNSVMDPSGSVFYPYFAADIWDVNHTWWKLVANKLGASIFSNNSSGGSCVYGTISSATQNMERVALTFYNDERPDYIFVYMGSNDAHGNFSKEQFDGAYRKMIDNIESMSPDSKIILITLVESNLYSNETRTLYNQIIKDVATEYELEVVDISSTSIKDLLIDSAHPHYAGMKKMADAILSKLVK